MMSYSVKTSLPVSAFSSVDAVARLRARLQARINGLTFQFINVLHSPSDLVSGFSVEIHFLSSLLYRLGNNSVVCNAYEDVRLAFKTFPASLELHSIKVLGSFTKKKYDGKLKLNIAKGRLAYAESQGSSEFVLERRRAEVKREQFSYDLVQSLLKSFEQGTLEGRKSELTRRLMLEVEQRFEEGWFFIFNTLTCDSSSLNKVFPPKGEKRSSAWTDYVRACDRYFGISAYGSFRLALRARRKGAEYHSYFAVVEKGSESGRLHIHVVHAFRSMPKDFRDPNYGSTQPFYREVEAMRVFWPHGNSSPIAVRFNALDAYSRAGWRWPVEQELTKDGFSYTALTAKPFRAIVGYVGKYLTKAFNDEEVGCIWRTRISRNLGRAPIVQILNSMPLKYRLLCLQQPRLKLKLKLTRLPRMLLRRLLLRSLPSKIFQGLYRRALLIPPLNLLKHFLNMIQNPMHLSVPNFGVLKTSAMRLTAVFNYFKEGTFSIAIGGPTYV